MKTIADADYYSAIRLLTALSQRPGNTRKEKEDARKASLLLKKLKRNVCKNTEVNRQSAGLPR